MSLCSLHRHHLDSPQVHLPRRRQELSQLQARPVSCSRVRALDIAELTLSLTCSFVLLKILQIPPEVNLWYQAALLQTELRAIFAHARPPPQDRQAERVAKLYRVATGEEEADAEAEGSGGGAVQKKVPADGDDCPICYEEFAAGSEKGLVFCLSLHGCGNALHLECFGQWSKQAHPV